MRVLALAGGIGAGRFLRGLVRAVPPADVTVVVNTGDDLDLYGLRVCPDLDSVTYWLSGAADRDRGWGRDGESFRTLEEIRRLGGPSWFGLGDLDLALHLMRTDLLRDGRTLSEATDRIARAFGIEARLLPMSDDPVPTWIDGVDEDGGATTEPFQVYWVANQARHAVKGVRFEGADRARPAPGVLGSIDEADVVVICPSNPVVSIGPILALPAIREALQGKRVVGVTPIVGGAPVRGMADRLMPAVGLEVSAAGVARGYRELLSAWVIDDTDAADAGAIRDELGIEVGVTDTIMRDDDRAEALASFALSLLPS